ncbi:diadenylate cyclase CdaA [Geomonas sp. Red69]|uniref:Diadenylate cyclase n=1 Tax=Geomonas diazotrophica TaxID=2843197 RepID=A0ABX8JE67_9BACT|nr:MULTISPECIES: diadenylate cyclase CdaA [Geomonas]MBU5638302.1 diadenylate cyclase CdaA [Geomonas diazotrophica]QWV96695.1 diadenylate cyclase CdaA [Geomonas nitrogeniifigens]QXE85798.1 diadenylate cyclase CdaA [Geomonas nitrogeniifigens]
MFPQIRPQDIADILIMTFLLYQLYSWFKNSKALQVVLGLLFLGVIYFVTKGLGLFMTSWILQELGTVLLVLLIVVFQSEIRQALYRLSLLRNLFEHQESVVRVDLLEFSATVFSLASQRIGALVVFQRAELLDDLILHGVPMDSLVSGSLVTSIFMPGSPLHDGAVLVKDGRVALASCHLPLSVSAEVPQHLGTRHRAALGLSERSDAVIVVVSEERGEVSLSLQGELEVMASQAQLHERLTSLLQPLSREEQRVGIFKRLFSNFWPKVAIFCVVVVSWLLITYRQGEILTVTAPVTFHNLPDSLTLTRSYPDEVDLQLKSFSNLVGSPKNLDIVVDLDLSKAKEGNNNIQISKDLIRLPPGVVVVNLDRSLVRVTVEKKQPKPSARKR